MSNHHEVHAGGTKIAKDGIAFVSLARRPARRPQTIDERPARWQRRAELKAHNP
jgi:hypothetical protein